MKYDSGMKYLHKDIIAALKSILGKSGLKEIKPYITSGSPAELREHLKERHGKCQHGGTVSCDNVSTFNCNSSNLRLVFKKALNNDGDTELTLTWSQTATFIRNNWDSFGDIKAGDWVEADKLGRRLMFEEMWNMVGELIIIEKSTSSLKGYRAVRLACTGQNDGARNIQYNDGTNILGKLNESDFEEGRKAWLVKEDTEKSYFDIFKEHFPKVEFEVLTGDYCPNEFFDSAPDSIGCDEDCEMCWRSIAEDINEFSAKGMVIPDRWKDEPQEQEDPKQTDEEREKAKAEIEQTFSTAPDTENTSDDALIYIDVNLIDPHPDNPRKNVGDVTELADSIKSNGIMQNLTVIPSENGRYLALIGHRRLAASKAAGLEKVPCKVITGLSRSEQVGIMLAENMQRADLTIVEQVEGIQLMLDLGDTVDTVADKTGLSKSTVYRRSRIAAYGTETITKSFEKGATLEDYELLDKVKDPEKRKELVKSIGTNNFKWSVENTLKAEKRDEQMAPYVELLDFYAEKIKAVDYSTMDYYKGINTESGTPEELIYADFFETGREYFYTYSSWSSYISVYVKREAKEDTTEQVQTEEKQIVDTEEQKRTEERRERIEKLKAIFKRMQESTLDFIRNFKTFPAKKDSEKLHIIYSIMDIITEAMCDDGTNSCDFFAYCELMGIEDEPDDDADVFEWSLDQLSDLTGEKKFLAIAYMNVVWPSHTPDFIDAVGRYREDKAVIRAYELLKLCGYELSDEERAVLDGTHELYTKEND